MITISGMRFITTQVGSLWFAQCLSKDICVQAHDFETLIERMEIAIEIENDDSNIKWVPLNTKKIKISHMIKTVLPPFQFEKD